MMGLTTTPQGFSERMRTKHELVERQLERIQGLKAKMRTLHLHLETCIAAEERQEMRRLLQDLLRQARDNEANLERQLEDLETQRSINQADERDTVIVQFPRGSRRRFFDDAS